MHAPVGTAVTAPALVIRGEVERSEEGTGRQTETRREIDPEIRRCKLMVVP